MAIVVDPVVQLIQKGSFLWERKPGAGPAITPS
jgi:hypothetical protein